MDPGQKNPLLFVHSTGPTHVHRRDEETKTSMRRHVMRDIGKSRRVVKRNPRLDQLVPLRRSFWDQDPLTTIEQHWPMDVFSAYGLALLGTEARNPPGSKRALPLVGGFWFPFAFTASAFLRHFSSFYASPTLLRAVYNQSAAKAQVLALERFSGTISCIERAIASPTADLATGDNVIRAVLAVICFNLLSLDYGQARLHLEGMRLVISARGGIERLQGNSDLALMVFWVDITASLLFNTRPNYPLLWNHMPADIVAGPRAALPNPISRLLEARESREELGLTLIESCIHDLMLVAQCIESRLGERGDATWKDEMFLGLRLNPIAHRLLDSSARLDNKHASHINQLVEMVRLGAILWIIWIKQRSRSYPGSGMNYLSDLCRLLCAQSDPNGVFISDISNDELSVRIWLIAVIGISSHYGSPERAVTAQLMADCVRWLAIQDLSDAKMRVRQMPWISAFDAPLAEIWVQLQ